MAASHFWIHGIGLEVETNSEVLTSIVRSVLGHFESSPQACAVSARLFVGAEGAEGDVATRALGRDAADPSRGEDVALGEQREISCRHLRRGAGWVRLDEPRKGSVHVWTAERRAEVRVPASGMDPWMTSGLCLFGITELLKQEGLYAIHAAAVERNGTGVLISGSSGRGKTTAALALMRHGYACLSDDHPMLRVAGREIEVLAFPSQFRITGTTRELIPGLGPADPRRVDGAGKSPADVSGFAQGGARSSTVSLVLFPAIVPESRSSLVEIRRAEALPELLAHGLLLTDPMAARRQFDMLSQLAVSARCYRLEFGRDVLGLGARVDALLGVVESASAPP